MGDVNGIVYRSRLELVFFRRCDSDPNILKWASEEFSINYISPKDNRRHRYFPDVLIQRRNTKDVIGWVLIEIKPHSQCSPPKKGKTVKSERRYIREVMTYGVNIAKWDAAKSYCSAKGWEWVIITEKDLNIKY